MKWVADENIDASIVRALRNSGHDVWYVADEARGIGDREVLQRAEEENALLITGDKDFGDLVFRQDKATAGVLLVRFAGVSAREKAELVTEAVRKHEDELMGAFSVLTQAALRVRKREGPG